MSDEQWEGPERRTEVVEALATAEDQKISLVFWEFTLAVAVAMLLMFNWNVTIYPTDNILSEHICSNNGGLKSFSKDSGGDLHITCNNKAEFDFDAQESARAVQEAKNDNPISPVN